LNLAQSRVCASAFSIAGAAARQDKRGGFQAGQLAASAASHAPTSGSVSELRIQLCAKPKRPTPPCVRENFLVTPGTRPETIRIQYMVQFAVCVSSKALQLQRAVKISSTYFFSSTPNHEDGRTKE
jgi:hypothetical protein